MDHNMEHRFAASELQGVDNDLRQAGLAFARQLEEHTPGPQKEKAMDTIVRLLQQTRNSKPEPEPEP